MLKTIKKIQEDMWGSVSTRFHQWAVIWTDFLTCTLAPGGCSSLKGSSGAPGATSGMGFTVTHHVPDGRLSNGL